MPYSKAQEEQVATILRERKEKQELLTQAKVKMIAEEQAAKKKKLEEEMKRLQQEEEERMRAAEEEEIEEEQQPEEEPLIRRSMGERGQREKPGVRSGAYTSGGEALPMRAGQRRQDSLMEIEARIAAHQAEIAALEASALARVYEAARDVDADTEEKPIDVVLAYKIFSMIPSFCEEHTCVSDDVHLAANGERGQDCAAMKDKNLALTSLRSISSYLSGSDDCSRMRSSVDKYLEPFDTQILSTPRGIFCRSSDGMVDPAKTVDDIPFECAPVALYDRVCHFLKDERDNLRTTMAASMASLAADDLTAGDEEEPEGKSKQKKKTGPSMTSKATKKLGPTDNPEEDIAAECESDEEGGVGVAANWDFQKKIKAYGHNPEGGGGRRTTPWQHGINFKPDSESPSEDHVPGSRSFAGSAALPPETDEDDELLLNTARIQSRQLASLRGNRQDLIVVASLIGRIPNLAGLARTCEVFKASSLVVSDGRVVADKQFQLISVTAERWIPIVEVPESSLNIYLDKKAREGYTLIGLEQTANSIAIHEYDFPKKTVLVLGREKEGVPVEIIQRLHGCVQIPQMGVIRSLNVHVSGAIATWEYTRQQLTKKTEATGHDC
ncbi:hypothetical protein CBR_g21115 [Chara braunii]|uniref:tRNA (guanosine(18)-2'-O)-methyltransferase TARBP1 n=1 Tax=Chara braunii TaxID=69332 RepID=A0A388L0R3_CHABU|nr:hypothetical protein CBR_g21115 [Chara braunii]|eukprot:GBG75871.1 hypothetical protein CBR_g21115 [Chara braunii]